MSGLLDHRGNPIGSVQRPKRSGVANFIAADPVSPELQSWHPTNSPVDSTWGPARSKVVSRVHDLVRNDGWASGGVTSYLDSVIGADLRLSVKPDWRALSVHNKAFDAEWAKDFASAVEAQWRTWAYDIHKNSDATRQNTIGEMFGLAFRHKLLDGDCVALAHWDENRGKFATFMEVMHPDRMSNPDGLADSAYLRSGVAKDEYGAATGYYFQGSHPGEAYYDNQDSFVWKYIDRQTPWGRSQVVHHFDKTEAHQTRGVSKFAPIVERMKMLTKYDKSELQAAVLNAVMAAYIESPMDHSLLENVLSEDPNQQLSAYQQERVNFHDTTRTQFDNVRIPTLFPGEKINFIDSKRPNTAFADFEAQALRYLAAGLGTSYEQISKDWSKTNYSSGRLALVEVWRSYYADREKFTNGFATPIYALFLEELMDKGLVPLPKGAPEFMAEPTAYSKCKWIGPARGWVDPVKEATGAQIRMENGLSTLEDECAEQGKDYEEVVAQRARERELWRENDLPDPNAVVVKEEPSNENA